VRCTTSVNARQRPLGVDVRSVNGGAAVRRLFTT